MTDFPDRPDHPDFWLLSEALIGQDAQVETGQSVPDVIGRYADVASLMYVAEQRALRMVPGSGPAAEALRLRFTAVWLDAFVAGVQFQNLKRATIQDGQL